MAVEAPKTPPVEEELVMVEIDDEGETHAIASSDSDERRGHAEGEQQGSAEGGRGHPGETLEERRERRRRENRAKRIRQKVTGHAKDDVINRQLSQIHELTDRVNALEGRTVQFNAQMLAGQLSQVEAQQKEAQKLFAELAAQSDFDGVAQVSEAQAQLRDQHRNIKAMLDRTQRAGTQQVPHDEERTTARAQPKSVPAARSAPTAPPPAVIANAKKFAERFPWAVDHEENEEEAAIADAVDRVVTKAGFDPATDDYWDELEDRLKKRLPHRFKKTKSTVAQEPVDDDEDEEVDELPAPATRREQGPGMSQVSGKGSRRPLKPNEVYISPQRKQAMQDAGIWDDPVERKKMLKSYAQYDKEHQG